MDLKKSRKLRTTLFVAVFLLLAIGLLTPIVMGNTYITGQQYHQDTNWYPPEKLGSMDLSDQEYVDLWGRISTLEANSREEEDFRDTFEDRVDEEGIFVYGEMVDGYGSQTYAKPHTIEWNRETINDDTNGETPPDADTDSGFLISETYVDITSTTPHTHFTSAPTDSETKYIPTDPSINVVSDTSVSSRSNERSGFGLGARRTTYSIDSTDREFTATATLDGEIIDELETTSASGVHDLDLSDAEADDEVDIEVEKTVESVEEERRYVRVCDNWETRTRTVNTPGGGTRTVSYRVCTSRSWDFRGNTFHNDDVTVTDETSGVIYNPTVEVEYSTPEDTNNSYLIEFRTDQPIAAVDTQDGQRADFPARSFSVADESYKQEYGSVTPVEHRYTLVDSGVFVDDPQLEDLRTVGPTAMYETPDVVQMEEQSQVVQEVEYTRLHGTTIGFDESEIHVEGIIPNRDVQPEIKESNDTELDLVPLNLEMENDLVEETDSRETNKYEITIEAEDVETGESIETKTEDVSTALTSPNRNEEIEFDTNEDGVATVEVEAQPGDQIVAEIEPTSTSRAYDDRIIEEASAQTVISSEIDDLGNIWTSMAMGTIQIFLTWFLGPIIMLALITYGFTGKPHPWA